MTEHTTGLHLKIDETIEVECETCNGTGEVVGYQDHDAGQYNDCPHCQGSGKRTVWLVGWVAVDEYPPVHENKYRYITQSTPHYYGNLDEIREQILYDYQARILPAELYRSEDNPDGLHEIDTDTDTYTVKVTRRGKAKPKFVYGDEVTE